VSIGARCYAISSELEGFGHTSNVSKGRRRARAGPRTGLQKHRGAERKLSEPMSGAME